MFDEILKSIPHQRIMSEGEIFDLYQCGIFNLEAEPENIELVVLQANATYRKHYHKQSRAVIYIIKGTGVFCLNQQELAYEACQRFIIPAGVAHGFLTVNKTLFLSIQSPPIINSQTGEIDLHYEDISKPRKK